MLKRCITISVMVLLTALGPLSTVSANTITLSNIPEQAVAGPQRGDSMAQVAAAFGEPLRRLGPVGDPPISRWVYTDIVVIFEVDRVLYSIQRNK